ncbi:hypothetical protein, partial [Enterococcus mundtii]|uniref:hypothetical protein n=1 Tax=Enterococcus mundtii TaxID=53346 RepID=UPI0035C1A356
KKRQPTTGCPWQNIEIGSHPFPPDSSTCIWVTSVTSLLEKISTHKIAKATKKPSHIRWHRKTILP